MFLGFDVYDFQANDANNVSSIGDLLKGFGVMCEMKEGYCFKKELCEIDNIKEMRLIVIKSRKDNIINSFGKNACLMQNQTY